MPKQQIIAMGGGGFSMEPDNLALDRYVLEQANTPDPSVAFIPTASGDSDNYIVRYYAAFQSLGCYPTHLSLFTPHTADIESYIMEQDVIYVGGGNTRSMLALWREWELDLILRQALEAGIVLAGLSAGAICWFRQGTTDSVPGGLSVLSCLGFLPHSCCPHYDGEPTRRPAYQAFIASGEMGPGYALDDSAAVHFIDGKLHRAVASRPNATAYWVEQDGDTAKETSQEMMALVAHRA